MTVFSSIDSLSILDDSRILHPDRYIQLVNVLWPACPSWQVIGPELVHRGWLTQYQVQEIQSGRGHKLFLDNYVILDLLGRGGMGKVFKAQHTKLNRIVALKVIRNDRRGDERATKRFMREIEALGSMSHPNIIAAYDAEITSNDLFYVMEWVDGMDLGFYVKQHGPLEVAETVRFLAQLCNALQHIHEHRLIHRDIKPSNLLRTKDGSMVKLLDLGLVRNEFSRIGIELTRVGSILGTPDFISPEQAFSPSETDIRSDLYSVGCTFYFLLTGQAPFEERETVKKLVGHAQDEPTPISRFRSDVPAELLWILRRLMAKKPAQRYDQPNDVIADLLPVLIATQNDQAIYWQSSEFDTPVGGYATQPQTVDEAPAEILPDTEVYPVYELGLVLPAAEEKFQQEKGIAWQIPFMASLSMTLGFMLIILGLVIGFRASRLIPEEVEIDQSPKPVLNGEEELSDVVYLCHSWRYS
jgi:eukaryotic-like serine/threonine-protein kinase